MEILTANSRAQNYTGPIDSKQLWENVLVDIELSISKANFSTWFKETHIARIEEGVIFVSVPNQFAKDWLSTKYHKFILKTLRSFSESVRGLEYVISKDRRKERPEVVRQNPAAQELPLADFYINRNDNLNPRYVFETFVVGPFNNLAHAAAQAIIQKPGIAYNPFFVYGGTGRGKTHLMQAVGNHLKKNSPSKKVFYMTSEKFVVEYVTSVENNKVNQFKDKYRHYDLLIMDDIQFLSKKEKSQEELFHLFNALYDNNKQIIFSSDTHPNYLQDIDERLKSRFVAGMIADISEPDYESRMAILQAKAKHINFILEPEIAAYLAENIHGNIRDLEGVLNSIVCQTQLKGKSLNLIDVKNLIKNTSRPKKLVSIKEVIKKVADFFEIEEASIYEKTRRKEVVKPRQLIMYILREDFRVSYPTIGQKLGGRDHTTVIHSCEKIKNDLKTSTTLLQELDQIRALLK